VDAIMFLALAALLVHAAERQAALVLLAVPFAVLSGTTLPDLDLTIGLAHRSLLTHGLLPALPLLASARWRPVGIGLLIGLGLHLAADSFPNAMRGLATVKLPWSGSIGATWSYAWLGTNAVAGLVAGGWLLATYLRERGIGPVSGLLVAIGVAALGGAYLLRTDGGWWALAVMAALAWWAVRKWAPSAPADGAWSFRRSGR
jgi:hypothetical protein